MLRKEPIKVSTRTSPADADLDRKGRGLRASSLPFLLLGVLLAVVGIILIVAGAVVAGAVLVALALTPLLVAGGLMLPGVVSWWAARHKPFA
jgi:Flp pilus assembly protein TadB